MTQVVNMRVEPYDVYIGRAGHGHDGYFGNPFKNDVASYEQWFLTRVEEDPTFRARVLELKDKTLGCFCGAARDCHGRVIAAWLDDQSEGSISRLLTTIITAD